MEDWRHEIVQMAAESSDYPRRDSAYCDDDCEAEWDKFDKAAWEALVEWGQDNIKEFSAEYDYSALDLWDDNGPYLIYMTLAGHGVGIWDGSWDRYFVNPKKSIPELQKYLERNLAEEYQKLEIDIHNSAYETTGGDAPYGISYTKEGVKELTDEIIERLRKKNYYASFGRYIGSHRWSDKNKSAYFVTHTPEYHTKVIVLISVFEDGDIAIDFFGNEGMSEIDRFENIVHFLYGDENGDYEEGEVEIDYDEMVGDITDILDVIDQYAASWFE